MPPSSSLSSGPSSSFKETTSGDPLAGCKSKRKDVDIDGEKKKKIWWLIGFGKKGKAGVFEF